jgi:hypothetical protein
MEWFIIGFFLYILMLSVSNWIRLNKAIKESDWKKSEKIMWRITLDAATILILTICFRRICLTLITLNIL